MANTRLIARTAARWLDGTSKIFRHAMKAVLPENGLRYTLLLLRTLAICSLSTAAARETAAASGQSVGANDHDAIILWPDGLPEPAMGDIPEESTETGSDGLTRRFNVSVPRMFVYQPAESADQQRAAVLVVPGGGYGRLADEHEGADACRWLASQGVVAFQLAYRTPTNRHHQPWLGPAQDIQKAVIEIRRSADRYGINESGIGVMGFSAGGQAALIAATGDRLFDLPVFDSGPAKPDFLLLLYPYQILDSANQKIRDEINLEARLPPTFIAQMADDTSSLPHGSTRLFEELLRRKVPVELHIYERGGHGFGMRVREGAPGTEDWPRQAARWLRQHSGGSGAASGTGD